MQENHKRVETSGSHLVQPCAQAGLCRAGCPGACPDSLWTSPGDSTASLGNLCQCHWWSFSWLHKVSNSVCALTCLGWDMELAGSWLQASHSSRMSVWGLESVQDNGFVCLSWDVYLSGFQVLPLDFCTFINKNVLANAWSTRCFRSPRYLEQ